MNNNQLNEAIFKHLPLWWTEESKDKIKSEFGEEVFIAIYEIYLYADKETEMLIKNGSDNAYQLTKARLKEHYDFLTEQSIVQIANMAAYSWK